MRFVDIEEEEHGPSVETIQAQGIEAQEAANQTLYSRALQLQSSGSMQEAAEVYRELLQQKLLVEAELADDARDVDAELNMHPSLRLRSLALKNLAKIESAEGEYQSALQHVLLAVQIQQHDAVLWHRLGTLAMRTEQK